MYGAGDDASTLRNVVDYLMTTLGRHPDEIRRHVMWLLKNGLLDVQPEEGQRARLVSIPTAMPQADRRGRREARG